VGSNEGHRFSLMDRMNLGGEVRENWVPIRRRRERGKDRPSKAGPNLSEMTIR
jgi:hypothetical protein